LLFSRTLLKCGLACFAKDRVGALRGRSLSEVRFADRRPEGLPTSDMALIAWV
jgi:hypothetical protein